MQVEQAVKTVSRNLVINVFGAFWQLALIVIGTRLVLQTMGVDSFAVLALVGGTAGYFVYLDIGIGETVIKKVSETNDPEKLSRTVSTLFFFAAGFGALLALLTLLFALYGVPALFSFPAPALQSASAMFGVIAAGLWVLYPLSIFSKVFVGLNRLDIYNYQRIVFQTLILVGMLWALQRDNSAEAAVAAITLGGIAWKVTALLMLRRMYPAIEIRPRHFDAALLRGLLRYKAAATASQAAGHTVYQCDIYMIGILLGSAPVALYSIANTAALKLAEAAGVIGTAAFPMISALHGANNRDAVRRAYTLGSVLMAGGLLPVVVFLFVHAEQVIALWVGAEYLAAAPALRWLLAAWFVNATTTLSTLTLKSVDRPDIEARIWIAVAAANVLLDWVMIVHYGFMGAVWATLITQLAGFAAINIAVCRHVELPWTSYIGRMILLTLLAAGCGAVYLLPAPGALFLIPAALHAALFAAAAYALVLNAEERQVVRNMAAIALGRREN